MAESSPLLQKPQINVSRSTAWRMWLVFCCAGLGVIQSSMSDEGASIALAFTAVCSSVLAEFLCTWRKYGYDKLKDGSAAASGMVLTLLLPNHLHPLYAAFGAFFAMFVVKHSFGGLGANWLNPALGGWLFIRFSWKTAFSKALGTVSAGNYVPFGSEFSLGGAGTGIDSFLNSKVFSFLGSELPSGYINLLFPKGPGIIADRGLLALLVGTVIIIALQVSRSWVPVVFLAVFGFLVRASGGLSRTGIPWTGDVFLALCTGGTIAGAFILAVEPVSGARSGWGVLLLTILSGILAWAFRCRGLELYGCLFAFLMVNALTPPLRLLERLLLYTPKQKVRGTAMALDSGGTG